MVNDLAVFTAVSKPWGLYEEYAAQLLRAGIDFHTYIIEGEVPNGGLGNLGGQMAVMEKLMPTASQYKKVVFTDGFDVLYFGQKDETLAAIPDKGVLQAAESPYWPYDGGGWVGNTPWRAVNGGMLAGTPESVAEWMQRVKTHFQYSHTAINQFWFNDRMKEGADFINIDNRTNLFYCMHKDGGEHTCPDGAPWVSAYNPYPPLSFKDGRPWNSLCDTYPQFIHFQARSHNDRLPAAWLEKARSLQK